MDLAGQAKAETGSFLVVEDDEHYARWLAANLEASRPNSVIRSAASREACKALLGEFTPQWAFVDLHLPDGSGIDIVGDILVSAPQCKALVITAIEDPELAIAAIQAGALGYLVKSHANWELSAALEEIERGGMPLTPLMAKRVLDTLLSSKKPVDRQTVPSTENVAGTDQALTEREKEILVLASRGYRNKEIATNLELSANTVASHIKSIYRKMNVHSRSHMRKLMEKSG